MEKGACCMVGGVVSYAGLKTGGYFVIGALKAPSMLNALTVNSVFGRAGL